MKPAARPEAYARAAAVVDAAIANIDDFDLKIEGATTGMPGNGLDGYVALHRHEYVRTVGDVLEHCPPRGDARVLEVGAFFGIVSICLSQLGYDVTAADMPEFIELPRQVRRYAASAVKTKAVRLEDLVLPFADEAFDVIIMCETLEHLNFNPLPLLKEINRVGAQGSLFYLSLPNAASLTNRTKALRGEALGVDLETFFTQLRPESSEIVNDHWREYTAPEVHVMLERLGYRIEKQYYFGLNEMLAPTGLKNRAARVMYRRMPWLKENQTTIAVKERRTEQTFRIPPTVHKTLRQI